MWWDAYHPGTLCSGLIAEAVQVPRSGCSCRSLLSWGRAGTELGALGGLTYLPSTWLGCLEISQRLGSSVNQRGAAVIFAFEQGHVGCWVDWSRCRGQPLQSVSGLELGSRDF